MHVKGSWTLLHFTAEVPKINWEDIEMDREQYFRMNDSRFADRNPTTGKTSWRK